MGNIKKIAIRFSTLVLVILFFVMNFQSKVGLNLDSQLGLDLNTNSHLIPQVYAIDSVSPDVLNSLDPLKVGRANDKEDPDGEQFIDEDFTTLGEVINRFITIIFSLAVMILFVMLFWAGYEIFIGATEKNSLESGKNRATMAIIGFILLFVTYWLMQVLETIFGIVIISF